MIEKPVGLELTAEDLQLIQTGPSLLLIVEDDRVTISQFKEPLDKLEMGHTGPAGVAPAGTTRERSVARLVRN